MNKATLATALVLTVTTPSLQPASRPRAGVQEQKVTVHILAERFRFSPDEIRIRSGATVVLILESDDTDHGFRILGTGIDRVIPKRGQGSIEVTFAPDRAGRYSFECSKLCGAGHDFMHGVLVVED